MSIISDDTTALSRGKYLTNFEAKRILEAIRDPSDASRSTTLRQQIDRSIRYCETCQQFSDDHFLRNAEKALRDVFSRHDSDDEDQGMTEADYDRRKRQEDYEIVTMLNLCPQTVADARAYVPSLAKRSDDEIQDILNELNTYRQ